MTTIHIFHCFFFPCSASYLVFFIIFSFFSFFPLRKIPPEHEINVKAPAGRGGWGLFGLHACWNCQNSSFPSSYRRCWVLALRPLTRPFQEPQPEKCSEAAQGQKNKKPAAGIYSCGSLLHLCT